MPKPPKQERRLDIPNSDHVARYCNPQRVVRDPRTKVVTGVFPQAFELRSGEGYLSTYWMEAFVGDIDFRFKSVLGALRKKFQLKPTGAFARLNAGDVVQSGTVRNRVLRIRDRSHVNDIGYSGIYGLPADNSDWELLALLAHECCKEVREVSGIDALP
jgi:hypothetical protein